MERKYRDPLPSKMVTIVGDNFISEHLYSSFKRYSKLKPYIINNISEIKHTTNYIIDCTFNENTQNKSLQYSVENDIDKILLLNHWKKNINEYKNIKVIQAIVPDVYGKEHRSFSRPGSGNNYDSIINYCTFIGESIRRIHEAKIGFIPNVYLTYGENSVKFLHIDNLYEPLQYIVNNINETSEYEIYDEKKSVYSVISTIKEVIGYGGQAIFENVRTIYNKPINKLPLKHRYNSFHYNIKYIYRHLIYNNERFMID
jgi:hypothetical protein